MTEQYTPTINKTELAPGLVLYKDVIPSYEQLVPYIEQVTASGMVLWETKEISGNSVETMVFDYPQELKDPNDHAILFDERMSLVLGGFFGFIESDYIQENNPGRQLLHDQMMLMSYGAGAEFPLSKDNAGHLSIMYYLNDDYEGGTIEFPNLGITYEPKANEAIIFPAADGFEYTIEKMIHGTKYSVLTYLR